MTVELNIRVRVTEVLHPQLHALLRDRDTAEQHKVFIEAVVCSGRLADVLHSMGRTDGVLLEMREAALRRRRVLPSTGARFSTPVDLRIRWKVDAALHPFVAENLAPLPQEARGRFLLTLAHYNEALAEELRDGAQQSVTMAGTPVPASDPVLAMPNRGAHVDSTGNKNLHAMDSLASDPSAWA